MTQSELFDWEKTNKGEGEFRAIFGPLRLDDEVRFKEGKFNEFCKSAACMDGGDEGRLAGVVEEVVRVAKRVAGERRRALEL